MFDYLYYNFPSESVVLVDAANKLFIPASSLGVWLNEQCLKQGSSLQGRREAFRAIMRQKKYIPVVLSLNPARVLIPSGSIKKDDTLYLCYERIARIERSKKEGVIWFVDGLKLKVDCFTRLENNMDAVAMYLDWMHYESQSSQTASSMERS